MIMAAHCNWSILCAPINQFYLNLITLGMLQIKQKNTNDHQKQVSYLLTIPSEVRASPPKKKSRVGSFFFA